ncbi:MULTISPECIES: CpaF family protein [unclassified Tatumella]|uniref:CpaF family protein n=1 Tax=unclassified Tatumella TaxID=2649542 RepID=UPI001BAF3729|nr:MULTISPECIES: CpaF family protein [unclassified Tatumella]MBS0855877.1 CpaF family protein [Tatumella sp. JGM16]MBS0876999.1 CpaF family protein [Tatumella sp. JGM82]MBS0890864.1 CpaF family protein [Tatumella sp. JGM94]MBS0901891.1 CpaF family protein [Tatumella sp. JGM100]MBS0912826.1 CpaF family protein [Tatumella sp. JGM91]
MVNPKYAELSRQLRSLALPRLELDLIDKLLDDRTALIREISQVIHRTSVEHNQYLPSEETRELASSMADEILGVGPLRELMEDESVSDILVNGPDNIFVERSGKLVFTGKRFIDNQQLTEIAKRLVGRVGRRVDESQPLVDARMADGSRLNVVINPVALDGTSISIRKFSNVSRTLRDLVSWGAMSEQMANFLSIAVRCQTNIVISGGTGSGKTTLLNALSQHINSDERIITLEDAAELKLQQQHVVRLETRMAGAENSGQITMRDLMINTLRMRPDRIIVGECRGGETFEMLQAMNTGHDGSMTTLHANSPRDALARLENMVMMANLNLPVDAIRRNITSAINLIVQTNRLYDGSRKITHITEVMGLEGDTIVMQDIFSFAVDDSVQGKVVGRFTTPGFSVRSSVYRRAKAYGCDDLLKTVFG